MEGMQAFDIRAGVSLAPFTTWKIGGPARYFCDVECERAAELVKWARANKIPYCVIGGGSNILVPSEGIDGLVIRLSRKDGGRLRFKNQVEYSASLPLARLLNYMAADEAAGFDFLAGIPGTVGGAVFMNAGTGGADRREMADVVKSVKAVLRNGREKVFERGEINFDHRYSIFQENRAIITKVIFDITQSEQQVSITRKIHSRLEERKVREPKNKKTAGSVFKAADGTPAAVYIEGAGLKGLRAGDAMVSQKHANWIENLGDARSESVMMLVSEVQKRVLEKFGVNLETEVRILKAEL